MCKKILCFHKAFLLSRKEKRRGERFREERFGDVRRGVEKRSSERRGEKREEMRVFCHQKRP